MEQHASEESTASSSLGIEPTPSADFTGNDAVREFAEYTERGLERQAGLDAKINERVHQAGIAAGTIVMHKGVWTSSGRLTEKQLERARTETARFLQRQAAATY